MDRESELCLIANGDFSEPLSFRQATGMAEELLQARALLRKVVSANHQEIPGVRQDIENWLTPVDGGVE